METTKATHKPGTLRSDFARAKIALMMFAAADEMDGDAFCCNMGRWEKFNHYGPVCWDNYNQLCRHLTPERATELRQILEDSDNGKI